MQRPQFGRAGSTAEFFAYRGGDDDKIASSGANCPPQCTSFRIASNGDHDFTWAVDRAAAYETYDGSAGLNEKCRITASYNSFESIQITVSRTEVSAYCDMPGGTSTYPMTVNVTEPEWSTVTVSAHSSVNLSTSTVNADMRSGTQDILLRDADGLSNTDDESCCQGLQLAGELTTFEDIDVDGVGQLSYLDINSVTKDTNIKADWSNSSKKKQCVVVKTWTYNYETGLLDWNNRSFVVNHSQGYIVADDLTPYVWIHEWGHLKGLNDRYYDIPPLYPAWATYGENFMGPRNKTHVRLEEQCLILGLP